MQKRPLLNRMAVIRARHLFDRWRLASILIACSDSYLFRGMYSPLSPLTVALKSTDQHYPCQRSKREMDHALRMAYSLLDVHAQI
jgi:hypothetical protein